MAYVIVGAGKFKICRTSGALEIQVKADDEVWILRQNFHVAVRKQNSLFGRVVCFAKSLLIINGKHI